MSVIHSSLKIDDPVLVREMADAISISMMGNRPERLFLFEWGDVLDEAYAGHIVILARSLQEARENYERWRDNAQDYNHYSYEKHRWIGDCPCCEGTNVILDKPPRRIIEVTGVMNGESFFIGCRGSM